ncbi:MAG: lamin tail domain-containing protein [Candidatus Eisenbacteria bacterium]|nr:lamin tail domain-containing protein [Candidatus Eisenbacteria bacterium]
MKEYRRITRAAAFIAAFAALVLFAGCGTDDEELLPRDSEAPLFINEILADNGAVAVDPDFGEHSDWIELYNAGAAALDLEGFSLTDDPSSVSPWTFPEGSTIPAGGFLLVWADDRDTTAAAHHTDFKLSASGESVVLRDADGLTADRLDFGEQEEDISWGRVADGGADWAAFASPTPGVSNTGSGNAAPVIVSVRLDPSTPGPNDTVRVVAVVTDDDSAAVTLVWSPGGGMMEAAMEAEAPDTFAASIPPFPEGSTITYWVSAEDTAGVEVRSPANAPSESYAYTVGSAFPLVFINEFLASNSVTGADPDSNEYGDWIELYNGGATDVDLAGWFLSDNPSEPLRWTFPEGSIVEAGGFFLLWADGYDFVGLAVHADFKLSKDGDEVILLSDRSGARIDSTAIEPQTVDVSTGRVTDGGAAWTTFTLPTPDASNSGVGGNTPPAFLSASLAPDPPAAGEAPTVTAVIVDSDGVDTATVRVDVGAGWTEIPLVRAAGDTFTAALPARTGGTPVAWYLYAADPLGAASYDPPAGPLAPRLYTVPGSAPSVLINEFLAGNETGAADPDSGETGDWIELYNAENSPIDLSGWTITDDPEAEPAERWTFPPGASIAAKDRLLLWADGEDFAGIALHADFKLNRGGESILLFDDAGDRADGITFGPQTLDVSYGRTPDGGSAWTFFATPTPGAANP